MSPTLLLVIALIGCGAPLAMAFGADEIGAIEDESTVDLVTTGRKSGRPRRVTIWFVTDGSRLYVQSGKDGATDWYRNLEKTPEVTLEFPNRRLEGRARPIDDAEEEARVHALFKGKYWLARLAGWVGAGFGRGRVVRIEPSSE